MVIDKTFKEHEIDSGMFATDSKLYNTSKTMSREKFDQIVANNYKLFHGVNYKDRVKFLTTNGYDVTRENLFDNTLSAKPLED